MFDNILSEYPKRKDVWDMYIDREVAAGQIREARQLFERMAHRKWSQKKMRPLLKKWCVVNGLGVRAFCSRLSLCFLVGLSSLKMPRRSTSASRLVISRRSCPHPDPSSPSSYPTSIPISAHIAHTTMKEVKTGLCERQCLLDRYDFELNHGSEEQLGRVKEVAQNYVKARQEAAADKDE